MTKEEVLKAFFDFVFIATCVCLALQLMWNAIKPLFRKGDK